MRKIAFLLIALMVTGILPAFTLPIPKPQIQKASAADTNSNPYFWDYIDNESSMTGFQASMAMYANNVTQNNTLDYDYSITIGSTNSSVSCQFFPYANSTAFRYYWHIVVNDNGTYQVPASGIAEAGFHGISITVVSGTKKWQIYDGSTELGEYTTACMVLGSYGAIGVESYYNYTRTDGEVTTLPITETKNVKERISGSGTWNYWTGATKTDVYGTCSSWNLKASLDGNYTWTYLGLCPPFDDSAVTYTQFITAFKNLADNYSQYATYNSSGMSGNFSQTGVGTNIWTFYIGNGPKKLMIDAEIHGTEYYSSLALYYTMQWLLGTSNDNSSATMILNDCTLICTPTVNPDSFNSNNHDKNQNYTYGDGVNLNRNFAPGWGQGGQSSNDSTNYYYRGKNPLDQNETIVIFNLMQNVQPTAFLDIHQGGGSTATDGLLIWNGYNTTTFNNTCTALYNQYVSVSGDLGVSTVSVNCGQTPEGTTEDQALQCGATTAMTFEINNSTITPYYALPVNVENLRMQRLRAYIIGFDQYFKIPLFAMKTKVNGWFYWPNMTTSGNFNYLAIEETFNTTWTNATGDQYGTNMTDTEYPFWFPDYKNDGKDLARISLEFGASENDPATSPTWIATPTKSSEAAGNTSTYLLDVYADGKIDGKDIALEKLFFGGGATGCYNTTTGGLYINFSTNSGNYNRQVDARGFIAVPTDIGTINNFTVNDGNGNKLGAMVSFWVQDIMRKVTVSNTYTFDSWGDIPSPGTHYYQDNTSVIFSTTSPIGYNGSVWWCTGWTGTGDIWSVEYGNPTAHPNPSASYTIAKDSTITWNWERYNNVTFYGTGFDQNIGGNYFVTINGTQYGTYQNKYSAYVRSGNTVNYTWTSYPLSNFTLNDPWEHNRMFEQYRLTDSGAGPNYLTITQDTNLTGNYTIQWLLVIDEYPDTTATTTPGVGTHWYDNGTQVQCSAPASYVKNTLTYYLKIGSGGEEQGSINEYWGYDGNWYSLYITNPQTINMTKPEWLGWYYYWN